MHALNEALTPNWFRLIAGELRVREEVQSGAVKHFRGLFKEQLMTTNFHQSALALLVRGGSSWAEALRGCSPVSPAAPCGGRSAPAPCCWSAGWTSCGTSSSAWLGEQPHCSPSPPASRRVTPSYPELPPPEGCKWHSFRLTCTLVWKSFTAPVNTNGCSILVNCLTPLV